MKHRIMYMLMVILYCVLSNILTKHVCFEFYVVPGHGCDIHWSYNYIYLCCLVLIVSIIIPIFDKKPSSILINILFLFAYIPVIFYFPKQLSDQYAIEYILYSTYMTLSLFILVFLSSYIKIDLGFKLKINNWIPNVLLIILGLATIFIIIYVHGISFSLPNIQDVYGLRAEFKENSNLVSGYAVMIGGYVISPLLMLISIVSSDRYMKYIGFPVAIFLIFTIFSLSGIKSIAFSALVIISLYSLFKRINYFGLRLIILVNLFVIINLIIYLYFVPSNIVYLNWLRRLIVTPGSIGAKYFEYFYIMNNDIWVNGNYPRVISEYYFKTSGSANTGFFVEPLASMGYVGLLINTMLLSCIMVYLNMFVRFLDSNLLSCMLIMIAYAMCNSAFFTVIFSYGLLLLIFLLPFFMSYSFKYKSL